MEPKFLGQGTYGCIYKPNIPCLNEKPEKTQVKDQVKGKKPKFISKLQRNQENSEREAELGKIIKTKIKQYNTRFAPIIDSCPVDIKVMDVNEVEKCDIITTDIANGTTSEYKSYKMRFAGKQSLGNYFLSLLSSSPNKIIKRLIETHIYLLKSLDKLSKLSPPIIHYDLKDNNIMYNEDLNIPIIIDFGLSFELNPSKGYDNAIAYEQYYVFYEKYPPWCIELVLLSYIVQKVVNAKTNVDKTNVDKTNENIQRISSKIDATAISNLKNICTVFITENEVYNIFTEEEREQFKQGLYVFVESYLGKSWESMFKDLQNGYASWDNYSLSVIYSFYMKDLISKVSNVILDNYNAILKKVILELPNNARPSIVETIADLKRLASTIDKKQYQKLLVDIKASIDTQRIDTVNINLNKRILQGQM